MAIDPIFDYSEFDYSKKICLYLIPYAAGLLPDKRPLNVLAFYFEFG